MRSILLSFVLLAVPLAQAAGPTPDQTITYDAGGLDLGEGVALSPDGGIVVVGTSQRPSGKDMVTVKLGADGRTQWSRLVDRGGDDLGADAVVTTSGDVIAVGTVTIASSQSAIVIRYNAKGEEVWAKIFDKGTAETARAVALDPSGNILLAGVALSSNGGDCFAAKFTPQGEEIWSKPVNLYWLDECFDIAAAPDGSVVLAGRLVKDGNFDILVSKLTASGSEVWTKTIGTPAREEARGVAVAPDGSIFITGTVVSDAKGSVQADAFLTALDKEGNVAWTRTIDIGGANDEGRGAAADAAGGVYVTGFGVVNGEKQSLVAKFTTAGSEAWRHVPGRPGIDGTGSVAVAADGSRLAIAGALQDAGADFDFLAVTYAPGRPTASFRVLGDGFEAGKPVSFEDTSTAGKRPIVSRVWEFGDGSTSTEKNPVHTFTQGGKLAVKLTVVDEWRTASSASHEVIVAGLTPASVPTTQGVTPTPTPTPPTSDAEVKDEARIPAPALGLLLAGVIVAALARRERA